MDKGLIGETEGWMVELQESIAEKQPVSPAAPIGAAFSTQLMCLPALFDHLGSELFRTHMNPSAAPFKPIPNNERVDLARFLAKEPQVLPVFHSRHKHCSSRSGKPDVKQNSAQRLLGVQGQPHYKLLHADTLRGFAHSQPAVALQHGRVLC